MMFWKRNSGIKDFDVVLNNLNKELLALNERTERGLIQAAAFIRKETETKPPKTPVDLGNLRASWFVVTAKKISSGGGNPKFKDNPKHKRLTAAKLAEDHKAVTSTSLAEAKKQKQVFGPVVILGYSANYALPVHENISRAKKWSRKGSGPKWLQTHIQMNAKKIVEIVEYVARLQKKGYYK